MPQYKWRDTLHSEAKMPTQLQLADKCSPHCLVHDGKGASVWYQDGSSPRSDQHNSKSYVE